MKSAKFNLKEGLEQKNRVLLLMNYSLDKTLSENKRFLSEQWGSMGGGPDYIEKELRNAKIEKEAKEQEKIRYTQGCKYPEKVIKPPRTLAGREGVLDCCCYYPAPAIGKDKLGQIEGYYIYRWADIEFWDSIKDYNDAAENLMIKFKKDNLKINIDYLIQKLTQIFPQGTVRKIVVSGETYNAVIKHSKTTLNDFFETFYFEGFFNSQNERFNPTPVEDDRNQYQIFIDDWGKLIQWTTVIVTAVLGVITEGATLPLTAELFLELGIGLAVGIRDIQKGDEIGGAFSILTGLLPLLKYSKAFKGYDPKRFEELAQAFNKSKLNVNSPVSEYVSFYNKLNKPQREILDKILRGGDVQGTSDILKLVSQEAKDRLPKLLENGFYTMWKQRPKLFKNIAFFERLWVRELSANAAVGVASYLTKYFYPELNTQETQGKEKEFYDKLDGVYENIPEKFKKQMTYYLMSNPENAVNFINSENTEKTNELARQMVDKNSEAISSGLINLYKQNMNDSSKATGDDQFYEIEAPNLTQEELNQYLKRGYKNIEDVQQGEKIDTIVSGMKDGRYIYLIKGVK